jgi:protein-S-isoprenylcysteine O-methyltransferase Ste14
MNRILAFIYGVCGFLLFNATLIYFIIFISPIFEPKLIDVGTEVAFAQALLINTLLMTVFGLQHSVMARPKFKQWWLKIIPIPIERSTYVFMASLLLILLCWLWQPLPAVVWQVENPIGYGILVGLFWFGWLFSLFATFLIDQFDLIGLRQVYLYLRGQPYTPVPFKVISVYKYIRHPIMLGTIIGLWATPSMSVGHLMLAIGFSIYIFIGIRLEEKDMMDIHGEFYQKYRQKTSMVMPFFLKKH